MLIRARGAALLVALAVLGSAAGCGGGAEGTPRDAAAKVAPRWQQVVSFGGEGHVRSEPFAIAAYAIQWRVTVVCDRAGTASRVVVRADDAPDALIDDDCTAPRYGFSIRSGRATLDVVADGRWTATVDQQVRTPLDEPPAPEMTAANRVSRGRFVGIDQEASGRATLYRLDDGRLALRLAPFRVTANSDLFVWISEAAKVDTSEDAYRSEHVEVGPLKATAGPQNYLLPEPLGIGRVRSVIIWCAPVRTAYGAARLEGG